MMVGWASRWRGSCLLLFHPFLAGSTLHLDPRASCELATAWGLGSVLATVLWFFLTCLWPGQVPRWVILVPRHVVASCSFVRMCSWKLARPWLPVFLSLRRQRQCLGGVGPMVAKKGVSGRFCWEVEVPDRPFLCWTLCAHRCGWDETAVPSPTQLSRSRTNFFSRSALLRGKIFQTPLLHYFSKSNNKSNHHHCSLMTHCGSFFQLLCCRDVGPLAKASKQGKYIPVRFRKSWWHRAGLHPWASKSRLLLKQKVDCICYSPTTLGAYNA